MMGLTAVIRTKELSSICFPFLFWFYVCFSLFNLIKQLNNAIKNKNMWFCGPLEIGALSHLLNFEYIWEHRAYYFFCMCVS